MSAAAGIQMIVSRNLYGMAEKEAAQELSDLAFGPTGIQIFQPGQILNGFEYSWSGDGQVSGWIEGLYAWFHDGTKEVASLQPAEPDSDGLSVKAVTIRDATYAFEAVKRGVSCSIGALTLWPGFELKLREIRAVMLLATS